MNFRPVVLTNSSFPRTTNFLLVILLTISFTACSKVDVDHAGATSELTSIPTAIRIITTPTVSQNQSSFSVETSPTNTPVPSTPTSTPSPTNLPTPTPTKVLPTSTPIPTQKPLPTSTPTTSPVYNTAPVGSSGSYTCNCSKACNQMISCAEAYYQLNTCGCAKRDGDNDGVPCESICE